MTDTTNAPPRGDTETLGSGSWLETEVDGRPVRFWIGVAVAIALVTLGLGAVWVWGFNGPVAMDDMADMPDTDVRLPPVMGFYEGEEIFFVHPETSDREVAEMLTEMMADSPVLVVPALADVPEHARDEVYVFTNGVDGNGPFGFQADVFPSAPEDPTYSPLRTVVLATWVDQDQARELRSAGEVTAAADAGELTLDQTDIVVNMPFLTWPEGER